ncbi:MAG: 30S ribosomal protein S1, partial [Fidelibacterota bacterium]
MIEEKKETQEVISEENSEETSATPETDKPEVETPDITSEDELVSEEPKSNSDSSEADTSETSTDEDVEVKVEVIEEEEPEKETEPEGTVTVSEPVGRTALKNYLDADILNPKVVESDKLEIYDEVDEKLIASRELYEKSFSEIREKEVVTGKVVNISDRDVFVDVGFKSEGIIPREEFKDIPQIGDEIQVFIQNFEDRKGRFILSKEKADFFHRWNELRRCYEEGEIVVGQIIKRIKGGMVVDLGNVFGFLPGSQIDVRPVTDFDEHVGMEYNFKVVKFNELRKNVVVSRKILLEDDLKEKRQDIIAQMEVGMVLEGTVKNITDFGAFVDLGGIDGLLHVTDITWGRINHPKEKLAIGDVITVKVIDFDVEKTRVSLGMKQLTAEPWENADEKYAVGTVVSGKVVNMMNYGVFIELEEGIEGLIHVSEMSWTRHIKHPNELFKLGDVVEAKVLSLDTEGRKISLGIKQLSGNPWDNIEEKYPIGSNHEGIVRNLTQFGAFVELEEGIDGLVHISDMSWIKNIHHPKEVVKKNQSITVKVLDVSGENRRLALGIKQVEEDPWPELRVQYHSGRVVEGTVIRALDKGIIFQLDNDLEGIVPLKRIPKHERKLWKDKFKPGEVFNVTVQELDQESKKVILM